jgi:flavin-dependent dehydrogenase
MDREIDDYRASRERCECPALERAGAVIGTAWLGHGDYRAVAGEDFALLGDAAGLADPFTGEGIRNAMRSSELMAEAWVGGGLAAYPALLRKTLGGEFRVSRRVRRWFFESGAGVRLVERAAGSGTWHAAVAAIVNGLNEHDGRLLHLLARWARSYRSPSANVGAPNEVRHTVPCGGRCSRTPPRDGSDSRLRLTSL